MTNAIRAFLALASLSQGIEANTKVKLVGLVQETGPGALGKRALELWATAASTGSTTVELDLRPYSSETLQADVASLISSVPSDALGVLVPPYGSGAVKLFVEAVPAGTEMPIMVWGGASDSIFSSNCAGKHCFGTFTVGSKYMTLGLQAVLSKSGKPLKVGLIKNDNGFSASVATGAVSYINSTDGLTLVGETTVTRGTLSELDMMRVSRMLAMKPDVVAVAGHSGGDVESVITEVKKSYVPSAIVATNSITSAALTKFAELGHADAPQCLLMPTQWSYSDTADPYIGWTSDAFIEAFGSDASYHAASAAAAGIAITAAINTMGSGETLASSLAKVNINSFYGKLKFNGDGSIDKPMFVQQKQSDKSPVFSTMFGHLTYPLAACTSWGPAKTCGEVKAFYRKMECCGSPAKSVDLKSLTSYDEAPAPDRDDMVAAKLLYVNMKMDYTTNPDITSLSDLRAFLGDGQGTAPWASLPGLRHKYFTYNSETQTTSGVYVFFSQAELDSYMETQLFKDAPSWPHVSKLTAEVKDVVPGTEKCIEKTQWPHSPPTREDLTTGKMLIVDITMNYTTGIQGLPASKEDLYYFFDAGGYTQNFAAVDGLRGKYFAYDDKIDHCYGFYTFINEASLRKYMDSDLFKTQGDGAHIAALTYEVQDILEGTERTMDLGSWER